MTRFSTGGATVRRMSVFAAVVLSVAGCSQGLPSAQQDAGESLRPLNAAQSHAQGDADEVDETFEVFFTNAQREAPSASLKEYYGLFPIEGVLVV